MRKREGKVKFMELTKKFPKGFFECPRPKAPMSSKDIIPIKWSKEVLKGKKEVIVKSTKKGK